MNLLQLIVSSRTRSYLSHPFPLRSHLSEILTELKQTSRFLHSVQVRTSSWDSQRTHTWAMKGVREPQDILSDLVHAAMGHGPDQAQRTSQ